MDLSINRLKLLGEKELKDLDEQIQIYKDSKNPFLDSTLDELQRKHGEFSRLINKMKSDEQLKEKEIDQLQQNITGYHSDYESVSSHITELEGKNVSLKEEYDTIQPKIDESNSKVDKLNKVKDELQVKLESITESFKIIEIRNNEMLDKIRQEIYEYTCKIKQSKQTHFEMYNTFVEDMNASVAIDTDISEYEKIFNSKKEYFMSILCRNMENYIKMRQSVQGNQRSPDNTFHTIHSKLCDCASIPCGKCNYTCYHRCQRGNYFEYKSGGCHSQGNCGGSCHHTKLDQVTQINGEWLKESCYPTMKNYISDPELSYLVDKLNYDSIFKLFITSNLFDEQLKTFSVYEFLCFISFIGSNGNCSLFDYFKY